MFIHVVLYWLKPGTPDSERESLKKDGVEMLKQIPSVRHIWTGKPAMTPREIVDNSYDVGLCVLYDDRAGHDAYQPHEIHQQFMAKHKPHWQRVQIYDFQ